MIFSCCEPRRLEVLRRSGVLNAIEFLEVLDHDAPPGVEPQRTLFVRLLRAPPQPLTLTPDNLRIAGGERIPTIGIEWVATGDALPAAAEPGLTDGVDELPRTLVIRTRSSGDFSRYTLTILASTGSDQPPDDFDPLLASIEFSFKVECPSDFDCAAPLPCPAEPVSAPRIDYLAKDYAGFRRLMLDRLSLLTPGWTERSPADLGITLVELLAFAADNLSYRQDVIANEAYLNTARQRVSVRRHARLVDYYLHEGCNARAFVHFAVNEDVAVALELPAGSRLLTGEPDLPTVFAPDSKEERQALDAGALIFETARAAKLHPSLNEISLYTWGDAGCCLPRGATAATLAGHFEHLTENDFLLFEEVFSPTRFTREDAARTHRHVVRLTRVVPVEDPSGGLFLETPDNLPVPVTRIEWDASDALPFALCISVLERPDLRVSVARGNLVLADHGETSSEELPKVPELPRPYANVEHAVGECCEHPEPIIPPLRFRPQLRKVPLTHGFALGELLDSPQDPDDSSGGPELWWSAAALRSLSVRDAIPHASLDDAHAAPPEQWLVQRDLLGSAADATDFMVEIDDDGGARLRFGDDLHGRRPNQDSKFSVTYRTGNGSAGNVGGEAIAHLCMTPLLAIDAIRNPLPAFGGVDAEDVEAARRDAPQAFRTQERAVTAADYAAAAERRGDVQRAAASFRWTGSWHTVFVTADRVGGAAVDSRFEGGLRRHLERFRMAGYDLEVDAPRFVPLDLSLHVCVKAGYFRSEVLRAVRDALSSVLLPDGRRGAFHPDNFTFGEPVYSSRIVAAAQSLEGVDSVRLDKFQRLVEPDPATMESGVIPVGRLEIAQLENNPNYRDRGRLTLTAGGGK